MIRYREFAISAASLAAVSLSSGCIDVGNLRGDWQGSAYINSYGATYSLPFSFTGTTTSSGFFGGTVTRDYSAFTRDLSISVAKGGSAGDEGTLQSDLTKTYTYSYNSGSSSYNYAVDYSYSRTFTGRVTKVGARQFDIIMDKTADDTKLTVNGDDQSPTAGDSPTTTSKVLECSTDGTELHCFDGSNNLMIFAQ